jgi:cysteine synthase A
LQAENPWMPNLHESILDTIGHTPVVRIRHLAPAGVRLYVKVEAFNPLGSVKDRLALGVIEDAERRDLLRPGQTVIEATSGNTGIGLAMVCAAKGYPLVVVMAENFSVERRKILRFLGAKVVLTPATLRGVGMLAKAAELAEAHGWFLGRQFENEANADVHSRTTAREIVDDFAGQRLDYWVTGFGTGGTLKGVARVLAVERPETRVVVCEPDNACVLASGVPQQWNADASPAGSHPSFRTHPVQGWSPDFLPRLAEDAAKWVHRFVAVSGEEAMRTSRQLATREGIFTGISGGATLAGALAVCASAEEGATVLCMLPDTGERYLSTPLFADVPEEMTEEELEISRSTPSARFDACGLGAVIALPEPTPEATAFVEDTIRRHQVVLFALEWCEFCWAVRKLFRACDVKYESVDLDAGDYTREAWGDRIRAALRRRIGTHTLPQVFVGGEHVGGCTETLDAAADGRLAELLTRHGVAHRVTTDVNPRSFFPAWLQPR